MEKSNSFDEVLYLGLITQTLEGHDVLLARMRDLGHWSSTIMVERGAEFATPSWGRREPFICPLKN
jgi:hypothetical protein